MLVMAWLKAFHFGHIHGSHSILYPVGFTPIQIHAWLTVLYAFDLFGVKIVL